MHITPIYVQNIKMIAQYELILTLFATVKFPDARECPPNSSPGRSHRDEPNISNYRGSEDDSQEPSSPSGEYSGSHPSKPTLTRFQKQPQHQQQVSSS